MILWDVIHKATQEDGTMLKLIDYIRHGMPNSGLEMDKLLREYNRFCQDLHLVYGVLCYRSHCGPDSPKDKGTDRHPGCPLRSLGHGRKDQRDGLLA